MENPPRLSILLVNYNGIRWINGCLDSVRRFAPSDAEVILVDNASTDGSAEVVASAYPWVKLLRGPKNLGFAGGNNLAATLATGEFLLLLNTDTVLRDALEPVVQWLATHQTVGAVGINMLNGDCHPQSCTGRFPTPSNLILARAMLVAPEAYAARQASNVDWLQGSFLMMPTKLWRTLHGLDEGYFMYVEDVDLCQRIRQVGYECVYLPWTSYIHYGGYNLERFPDIARGLVRFIDTHHSGLRRAWLRLALLVGNLNRTLLYGMLALFSNEPKSRLLAKVCRIALLETWGLRNSLPTSTGGNA